MLVVGECGGAVAVPVAYTGEADQRGGALGMVGAERRGLAGQRAAVALFGGGQVAPAVGECGQVVDGAENIVVYRPVVGVLCRGWCVTAGPPR